MAERPTSHSIAVCTLIALHSDPSSLLFNKKSNSDDNRSDKTKYLSNGNEKKTVEDHLSRVIEYLVLANHQGWNMNTNSTGSSNDIPFYEQNNNMLISTMPLYNLLEMISGGGSKSPTYYYYNNVAKFLLDDLLQSCKSIDSLVDLFTAFRSTVAKGIVDGDSAHGVYVRKRCLGFDQLSFEAVSRLWETFCNYVLEAVDPFYQNLYPPTTTTILKPNHHHHIFESKITLEENRQQHQTHFKNNDINDQIHNTNITSNTHQSPTSFFNWPLSPRQISSKLIHLCESLHKQIGILSYEYLEEQIQRILLENPELSIAHYLRILNCIYHNERVAALESFHRYFDYAMIQERKDRLQYGTLSTQSGASTTNNMANSSTNMNSQNAAQGNNTNNNNSSSNNNFNQESSIHNRSSNVAQYAAILLTNLLHSLGHDDLAHIATEEAVKVAQQSGDGACLAYALGWLHATTTSNPNNRHQAVISGISSQQQQQHYYDHSQSSSNHGLGYELLTRASARASQFDLRSLVSGTSLLRADLLMSSSSNGRILTGGHHSRRENSISTIWDSIAAASASIDSNNQYANTNYLGQAIPLLDIPTQISNVGEMSGLMDIFGQQQLATSGLWRSTGKMLLSSTASNISLYCYGKYISSDHVAFAGRTIASSVLYGVGSEKSSIVLDQSTEETLSLCRSLERLRLTSKQTSSSESSHTQDQDTIVYKQALEKMRLLRSKYPNMIGHTCAHETILLKHEWAVRRSKIELAASYHPILFSNIPVTSRDGIKASMEAMSQYSLFLCRTRQFEEAKELIIRRILPLCESYRFHYHHAYHLLQIVLIMWDVKPDDCVSVLPYLLECLSISETFSIDPIHASAISLLARVHLELNNQKRAKSILKASLPTILQHGHLLFQGEAWLTMVKCTLYETKELTELGKEYDVCKKLRQSVSFLREAALIFEKLDDVIRLREVYYLMARVFHLLDGHHRQRDEASRKFCEANSKKVSSIIPTWYDSIISI